MLPRSLSFPATSSTPSLPQLRGGASERPCTPITGPTPRFNGADSITPRHGHPFEEMHAAIQPSLFKPPRPSQLAPGAQRSPRDEREEALAGLLNAIQMGLIVVEDKPAKPPESCHSPAKRQGHAGTATGGGVGPMGFDEDLDRLEHRGASPEKQAADSPGGLPDAIDLPHCAARSDSTPSELPPPAAGDADSLSARSSCDAGPAEAAPERGPPHFAADAWHGSEDDLPQPAAPDLHAALAPALCDSDNDEAREEGPLRRPAAPDPHAALASVPCGSDGSGALTPAPRNDGTPTACAPSAAPSGRMHFYLGGDPLELVLAPGDVIVIRGTGRLAELGNAGGFMGHVLVVLAAPRSVPRHSPDAADLLPAWPAEEDVMELWRVHTMESTRRETGLYESELLVYLQRRSRQLILVGEVDREGELSTTDHEVIELWQSPEQLRCELHVDIMAEVIADMRATQADWSARTAARALLTKAAFTVEKGSIAALDEIRACWERAPICTSVVISFWQRYFFKLAAAPPALEAAVPGTIFLVGERVAYWSESFRQWMNAVVTGQNCSTDGTVVSYNLDIKCGALTSNIRRQVHLTDRSVKALELILSYMPLKADRALPGDLLRSMRECGWVAVPQVPQLFRQVLLPSEDIACNPL
mmetsp:Transcript_97958/g.277661  ORF Transcript_97958/g.277661 Transcript_97958/m.277661 type:complete len:646 (-) Transcript_97958:277-2214(-)